MSTESGTRQEQYTQWGNSQADAHHARRTATAQAAFFLPYLRPAMRLLDCGCGPGTITAGFAELLGEGEVVGLDLDEAALERARAMVAQRGVTNIRFEAGDLYHLPYPDSSFDAVFSHAVLEHLGHPVAVLREMYRVLRPGGVVGVRIPDWDGLLLAPADPLLTQLFTIVAEMRAQSGGDMYRGKYLRRLLRQAGFSHVQGLASYDCHGTPESIRAIVDTWFPVTGEALTRHPWIAGGWVDHQTLSQIVAAFQGWAADSDSFLARSFCEAIGWRSEPR